MRRLSGCLLCALGCLMRALGCLLSALGCLLDAFGCHLGAFCVHLGALCEHLGAFCVQFQSAFPVEQQHGEAASHAGQWFFMSSIFRAYLLSSSIKPAAWA
eukprot:1138736-Pelagomonas_calceolata.AAC.9